MRLRAFVPLLLIVPALTFACGDDDDDEPKGCTVGDNSGCDDGFECQAVAGGDPACFCSIDRNSGCGEKGDQYVCEATEGGNSDCYLPLYVKGMVFDLADNTPIEGARVVARDANNAADSGVAVTDAAGVYSLRVAAPRRADGTIAPKAVFIRADAAGYQTFPTPPRIALPVQLEQAAGEPLTVESTAADVGMIKLSSTAGLGTIRGKVHHDAPRGTLVVAGGAVNAGGGVTGVADFDGTYAVFNVPAGSVGVRGYKANVQLDSTTADVKADAVTEGVDLHAVDKATSTVDGKVEIVNPGDGQDTSVIFVVDETFNPTALHGEAPPGLRVFPVAGAFTLAGVPDGNYVVLAAFENDNLVRDPDTAIGGTSIVHITVAGNMVIDESFKVTGSLDVVSPDKEMPVSGTPTFIWSDDSGEDHYEIRVFDAFGTKVWEDLAIPGVSGSSTVEVQYGGPALTAGLVYQFRATSIKQGGTPISQTEDLRGTFLFQ